MSYLDSSGGPGERRRRARRERADDGPGREGRHRARHTDAAPDDYRGAARNDYGDPLADEHAGAERDAYPAWLPEPDLVGADRPAGFAADPAGVTADPAGVTADRGPVSSYPGGADTTATGAQTPQGGPTTRSGDQAEAGPSPRRAGRNLPAAIAVGLTLGALVVASLFVWRPAFLVVIIAAVGVATWEMTRAVRHSGAQPPLVPLLVGGAVMAGLAWFSGPSALVVGLLLTVVATRVWRLGDGPAGYHRDVTAATLISVYVPFLAGFAALLAAPDDGALRVIATLAAVVLSDTGGYVTGVFFGKRPMARSVSPKKSWEGLAGSLLATAVGSAVLLFLLLDVAWWWGLVFGVAVSAAAVLGDLAESLIKRDLGIKDMSQLLPGHGGLMDRLDSILLAAPTAYMLLSVLAPATR
jgi:phosphatidate cytidylyltransferase